MKYFALLALVTASLRAQARGPVGPPPTARAAAPMDITGYWVSPVMEDWRWRMVTPLKGDAASVPINAAGRKIVDAWDPAKEEAAGTQCKAYGAAGLMRIPGHLHITWQDESTLKIETDRGTQTRLLHFGGLVPASEQASLQGYSVARWEAPTTAPAGVPLGLAPRTGRSKSLEVITTRLREGYLRKNGVPYSANTTLTEYFDKFREANGDEWFTITTIVTDPTYLAIPFVTTTDYKKEPDGSKFKPEACSAR